MSDKYAKLYVCSDSKFIGTAKMFLDKGVDVYDTDNTTIYCIDDPEELSIIRGLDTTTNTLEFTDLELDEQYKTAKVHPVLVPIPEQVKEEQTNKFKNSFKRECINLLNITQSNPLVQIKHNDKYYSSDVNLASVWLLHLLSGNVRIELDPEGYVSWKFREGIDYHMYLTDSDNNSSKFTMTSDEMDDTFQHYLQVLHDTIEHTHSMYDKIDTYTHEDMCRYNF